MAFQIENLTEVGITNEAGRLAPVASDRTTTPVGPVTSSEERPLLVTQFRDRYAFDKHEWSTTWPGFVEWLDTLPRCHRKDDAEWVKLATFGNQRTPVRIDEQGIRRGGSLRSNANMLHIDGVEGDYDDGEVAPAEALERLESHNLRAVIVTTYSHTPDRPRWRVFAPLSRSYSSEERRRFVAGLNGALGGILNKESYTQSQGYYIGGAVGGEYKVLHTFEDAGEGYILDAWDDLDLYAGEQTSSERTRVSNDSGKDSAGETSEWLESLRNAEGIHPAATAEVARLVAKGLNDEEIRVFMQGAIDPDSKRPERVREFFDTGELQRQIDGARAKGFAQGAGTDPCDEARAGGAGEPVPDWPAPVDLFSDRPVPEFPAEIMPTELRRCAEGMAEQSGFDPGAYLFVMLAQAGGLIDHRTRLQVNQQWQEPPYHWAAIVDISGGGKTPVLKGAGQFAEKIYASIARRSSREYAEWAHASQQAAKGEAPEKPVWRQRNTDDTTIEALARLLANNPQGVTVSIDELVGWLGRMDVFSPGSAGKDRSAWLDAWSGYKDRVINRAKYDQPLVVEHWAAGVIGAIQPEMLARQFKRAGGSSDGLLQRFMVYQMRPSVAPNLTSNGDALAAVESDQIFHRLASISDGEDPAAYELDREAVMCLQQYITDLRTIKHRTPGERLAEHLSKFPAFAVRLTLTLHLLNAAADKRAPERTVPAATMKSALKLLRVLFRHSEAVYGVLDDTSGEPRRLAVSASEAILTQSWKTFTRGDLTRRATGWRGADRSDTEAALDLLIETDWLRDITEDNRRGGRGRRSDGQFLVNPEVHSRFERQSTRIRRQRQERHEAIKRAAAARRAG